MSHDVLRTRSRQPQPGQLQAMLIGGTPETSVMNVELSGSQIRYGGGGGESYIPNVHIEEKFS